jgi:hypothetical protein
MDKNFDELMKEIDENQRRLDEILARPKRRSGNRIDTHLPIPAIHGDKTMTQARFCKDCRFSELHTSPQEQWVCVHPSSRYQPAQSLVTGHIPEPRQLKCAEARFMWENNYCAKEGRHWDQR